MPEPRAPRADDSDDRTAQATEHLQRAAIEFIAAARVLLDVAEEAVREPAGLMTVMSETLGALLGVVGVGGAPGAGSPDTSPADPDPPPRTAVEHIRLS